MGKTKSSKKEDVPILTHPLLLFVHEVLSDKNLLPVLDVDALLSLLHALACKVVEKSIIFFILNRSNDACFLVCRNAYRIYVVELISIVIVFSRRYCQGYDAIAVWTDACNSNSVRGVLGRIKAICA